MEAFLKEEASRGEKVALYAADSYEPNLESLVVEFPQLQFFFPKVVEGYHLEWVCPEYPIEWTQGLWNIREPKKGWVERDINRIDWVFVPALGFHTRGYRLGRGKGYYDRALSNKMESTRGNVVGIAYSCNLGLEFSVDPHDFLFLRAISENGIVVF